MGLNVEIRLGLWSERLEALRAGDIDILQGMFYSLDRDLDFDFTPAHTAVTYVAAVRRDQGPPPEEVAADDTSKESLSEIFERRQIKYMLGKKVSRDIEDDAGDIIIGAGNPITEDVIEKAKKAGKFLELSMNIEIEE